MSNTSSNAENLPRVIRSLPALARTVRTIEAREEMLALVPTMGALHAGHLSLVRLAQRSADRVIVSIFVNPTQFAPHEDLDTYPRTLAADLRLLAALKVDFVWAPAVGTMYPDGFATKIVPEGAATAGLEDTFRPHFFAGVATVVAKLLIQCQPNFAVFGQKDYQQLKVVTQLARDLDLKTHIIGAPIVRETDGLALSSRNRYLSPQQRAIAPTLHDVLSECARALAEGGKVARVLQHGRRAITQAGFKLDYLEARHALTLAPLTRAQAAPIRLLVAAHLGTTRLIDNIAVR